MRISKTEINLRRLLAASPHQLNQQKLVNYVATLREQLEQLAEEETSDGLPRVSNAQVNDYSVKIEAIASKLAAHLEFSAFQKKFQSPPSYPLLTNDNGMSKPVSYAKK